MSLDIAALVRVGDVLSCLYHVDEQLLQSTTLYHCFLLGKTKSSDVAKLEIISVSNQALLFLSQCAACFFSLAEI